MRFRVQKVDRVTVGTGVDAKHVKTAYFCQDAHGWENTTEFRIINQGLSLFKAGDVVEIKVLDMAPLELEAHRMVAV